MNILGTSLAKEFLENIPNKYEILYGLLKSTINGKLLIDMTEENNKILYVN